MYPLDYSTGDDDECGCTFAKCCPGHASFEAQKLPPIPFYNEPYLFDREEAAMRYPRYRSKTAQKRHEMAKKVKQQEPKKIKIVRGDNKVVGLKLKDLQPGETFRYPAGNPHNIYMVIEIRTVSTGKLNLGIIGLFNGRLYPKSATDDDKPVIRTFCELAVQDDV